MKSLALEFLIVFSSLFFETSSLSLGERRSVNNIVLPPHTFKEYNLSIGSNNSNLSFKLIFGINGRYSPYAFRNNLVKFSPLNPPLKLSAIEDACFFHPLLSKDFTLFHISIYFNPLNNPTL